MALLSGFDELDSATDTFSSWLSKTNELILLVRGDTVSGQTSIMTANSLPGGSQTFGNATLFGQYAANAMVVFNDGGLSANTLDSGAYGGLRGGIWNNSTNTITSDTLYIVSNTTYTDESAEVYINSTYGLIVENNIEARYDVLFVGNTGSNTNPQLHWENDNNTLNFNDDVRATFGTNNDLEIWYSGTKAYANTDNLDIRGTTNVNIITDVLEIRSETGAETFITANVNNGVELYWNNILKMTTNTHGVEVYGQVIADNGFVTYNNQPIEMGGTVYSNTHNFEIVTDGVDTTITESSNDLYFKVADNFIIQNAAGLVNLFVANTSGEVTLYHNNNIKLQTNSYGVEVTGLANTGTMRVRADANFDGSTGLNSNNISWDASANTLYVRDNSPIIIGDGNDLTIKHDGINSYITEANTGSLVIEATDLTLRATDGSRYVECIDGTEVRIYSPDNTVALTANNNQIHITDLANTNILRVRSNAGFHGSAGANTLTWTASSNTLNFADNNFATFGTSADLRIYHDGINSFVNDQGTGGLYNITNSFNVRNGANTENIIVATQDAGVQLYFNNILTLGTTTIGVNIEGEANTDTLRVQSASYLENNVFFDGTSADALVWESANNLLSFNDSVVAAFGTGNDLVVYHNGLNGIVRNSVGEMYLEGNGLTLRSVTGNENYITADLNGAVTTYYDNAIKLATTSTGINVTGNVVADGLTIDGNSALNGNVDLGSLNTQTISLVARVDTDIIPNNNTHNLGDATRKWNNLWIDGTADIDTLTVNLDASVSGNVTATDFIGSGDQLTDLNATNITSGILNDARLPNTITSDITGTATQANTFLIQSSTSDIEYRIPWVDTSGTYRNMYTDPNLLYNPNSDTLTVPNLIITTGVTFPGDIAFSNTTTFENIVVSNTAVILNLEVTTLEANGVAFTGTGGDVTSTSATVIDSFPIGQTQGYKYFVHGESSNTSHNDAGYAVEVNVIVTDETPPNIFYTRYGEVENAMADVTIVPQVSGNNTHIDLLATCGSASVANTHVFKVLKIETRPL